jgi:hypothetical protein
LPSISILFRRGFRKYRKLNGLTSASRPTAARERGKKGDILNLYPTIRIRPIAAGDRHSFLNNLGRATTTASWSDSAAQSVIYAACFRRIFFSVRTLNELAASALLFTSYSPTRSLVFPNTLEPAVIAQLRNYATIAGRTKLNRWTPISNNLVLAYLGQHVLGMPKSY